MKRDYRKKSDEALLLTLVCGSTAESAASKCGISARTVRRRLQDPQFKDRLDELHHEIISRGSSMLTAASAEAIKTLLDVLKKETASPHVRVSASRALLELSYKYREIVELRSDLTKLETLVKKNMEANKSS